MNRLNEIYQCILRSRISLIEISRRLKNRELRAELENARREKSEIKERLKGIDERLSQLLEGAEKTGGTGN